MINIAFLKSAARDSWYLLLLLVVILGTAAYKFVQEIQAPPKGSAAVVLTTDTPLEDLSATQSVEPQPPRPTEQDDARAVIADYQHRLDEDPKQEDAPALLNAMANFSRHKLGDYKEAARCYELLLNDYPGWPGIARVYPQLATCYERAGDTANQQWVYRRMMEKFPQDSQEYLYAKSELGL